MLKLKVRFPNFVLVFVFAQSLTCIIVGHNLHLHKRTQPSHQKSVALPPTVKPPHPYLPPKFSPVPLTQPLTSLLSPTDPSTLTTSDHTHFMTDLSWLHLPRFGSPWLPSTAMRYKSASRAHEMWVRFVLRNRNE